MSKEFPQFSEDESVKAEGSAKPKRPAGARARKMVSTSKPEKIEGPMDRPVEVIMAPVAEAKVAVVEKEVASKPEPEWAEAAPESVGGAASGGEGGSKRKRRRRKGKGGGASAPVEGAEVPAQPVPAIPVVPAPNASAPQAGKTRINPEHLAKSAWKIYLAEVSEEGVALVGDQDARELARRCFRLAEIFLEEQGRRSGGN